MAREEEALDSIERYTGHAGTEAGADTCCLLWLPVADGLGWSIARRIASTHGLNLVTARSTQLGGLKVWVTGALYNHADQVPDS